MNKNITTRLFTLLAVIWIIMGHSAPQIFANGGYRTIGLPTPNSVPVPVVHSVAQRAGTNILDIDFEIRDQDDETATVGILANTKFGVEKVRFYPGSILSKFPQEGFYDLRTMIIPTSLIEGTENKIAQPIATNTIHRVSWYVKGDWDGLFSDNLRVGIFAQDARRKNPVDLHFLTLPIGSETITISRSPVSRNEGLIDFLLFKLSVGELELSEIETIPVEYSSYLVDSSYSTIQLVNKLDGTVLADNKFYSGDVSNYTYQGSFGTKYYREAWDYFLSAFGDGYRFATDQEVLLASEGATPGQVNNFDASNRVGGLPRKINEYGFDPVKVNWESSFIGIPGYFAYSTHKINSPAGIPMGRWIVKEQ